MSEIEANEVQTDAQADVIDPIKVIYEGECPSISGRSTLCFVVGRLLAPVGRLVHLVGAPHPLAYRVARQARGPGYFVQRFLVA